MEIYTVNYELARPTPQALSVPLNSTFGIAVGLTYNGEPLELKQGDLTMNGELSEAIYANKAIFKVETDDNEGRLTFEITGTGAGGGIDDTLTVDETWIGQAGQTPDIEEDLADWAGVEIVIPHGNQGYNWTPAELAQVPFYAYAMNGGTIQEAKLQTWFCDKDTDQVIGYIQKTGRSSSQKIRYTSSSGVDSDRFVIPPNCYCKLYGPATYGEIHLKATYTKTLSLPVFELFIDKKNMGKIEGYNDTPIFEAITLSGTLQDDTPFSYTIPTTE